MKTFPCDFSLHFKALFPRLHLYVYSGHNIVVMTLIDCSATLRCRCRTQKRKKKSSTRKKIKGKKNQDKMLNLLVASKRKDHCQNTRICIFFLLINASIILSIDMGTMSTLYPVLSVVVPIRFFPLCKTEDQRFWSSVVFLFKAPLICNNLFLLTSTTAVLSLCSRFHSKLVSLFLPLLTLFKPFRD